MTILEFHSIEVIDDATPMQLAELLARTRIERQHLIALVEAGVLTPTGASIEQWTFVRGDLKRLRTAQRLIADLELDPNDVAVVLDLLEERNTLRKRIHDLQTLLDR